MSNVCPSRLPTLSPLVQCALDQRPRRSQPPRPQARLPCCRSPRHRLDPASRRSCLARPHVAGCRRPRLLNDGPTVYASTVMRSSSRAIAVNAYSSLRWATPMTPWSWSSSRPWYSKNQASPSMPWSVFGLLASRPSSSAFWWDQRRWWRSWTRGLHTIHRCLRDAPGWRLSATMRWYLCCGG